MKVLKSKLAAALCLTLCLSSFLAFSTTPVDAQITSSTVTQTQSSEAGDNYGRSLLMMATGYFEQYLLCLGANGSSNSEDTRVYLDTALD